MEDSPLPELLRQDNINNENHLISLYDFSWKYFPETGRSTGACIIFDQGEPIDHGTHVLGPIYQSISESEYNTA